MGSAIAALGALGLGVREARGHRPRRQGVLLRRPRRRRGRAAAAAAAAPTPGPRVMTWGASGGSAPAPSTVRGPIRILESPSCRLAVCMLCVWPGGSYQEDGLKQSMLTMVKRRAPTSWLTGLLTCRSVALSSPIYRSDPDSGLSPRDPQNRRRRVDQCRLHRCSPESLPRIAFSLRKRHP